MSSRFQQLGKQLASLKVLIIGDVMIDSYMWGVAERQSPEADVPIVDVSKREIRLGGAGNVGLNLKSLGCEVSLLGMMGEDHYKERYLQLFQQAGISAENMLLFPNRINTVKTRVIANNKHLLRVDEEEVGYLTAKEENIAVRHLDKVFGQPWDLVIFEDYNKGLLTPIVIEKAIAKAQEKNIPIAVDPKAKHISSFQGVDLFKPNLKELGWALGKDVSQASIDELVEASRSLLKQLTCKSILLTLSERGMLLVRENSYEYLPAFDRNIVDVSGAGDTVISVAATSLALKLKDVDILGLANLAGGLVCENAGVVPIDLNQLIQEAELKLE